MKTSGLSQIAAVLGVFYLRTHRFYKDLIDICTGIRYDKGEHNLSFDVIKQKMVQKPKSTGMHHFYLSFS